MADKYLEDFSLPNPPGVSESDIRVRPPRIGNKLQRDMWGDSNAIPNEWDTGLQDKNIKTGIVEPLPGMLSQRESSIKQEDWKKAMDERFRQGERSREPFQPTPWDKPEWMQNDSTPPAIDPETAAAKDKFQSFLRGVPAGQPSAAQDVAGQQSSSDFWKNIWENPVTNNPVTQAAVKQGGDILGGIGEGFTASGQNTEAGLGVIQAADLLSRKQNEIAGGNKPVNISQIGRAAPRTAAEATAIGNSVVQKEHLSDDELNRLNSFWHNLGAISDETGLGRDDWRVIAESARRMREQNPSGADTLASFLLDPTNIPFAAIGPGAEALSRGGRAAAGAGKSAIEEIVRGGLEGAPAFAADQAGELNIQKILDALKKGKPGDKTLATNVEQMLASGKTQDEVLQTLQGGTDVLNQGRAGQDIANEQARGLDLARVRSIAKQVGENPNATQADRIAAQEAVAQAEGKAVQPGTGGALAPLDPAMEAKLQGKIPNLTPEQIAEANAPMPQSAIEHIVSGGDETNFGGGDAFGGMGFASKGGKGRQAADEAAAAKLNPQTAIESIIKRPRYEQATIFDQASIDKGKFTKPGENFPREPSKKQQAIIDAKAQLQKPKVYDVPGDLTGVGDIEQAMIDNGVRTKGFDIVNTLGAIGSTALRAPRELAASGDISGSFRQGLIGAIMHNPEWRKAMGHQLQAFSVNSDTGLKDVLTELAGGVDSKGVTHAGLPSYEYGKSVGLASDMNPGVVGSAVGSTAKAKQAGYEAFTNAISKDFPVLGGLVRASDQAYEGFLASLRANIFDTYAKSWGLMDADKLASMTPKQIANSRKEAEQLASFINSITGYGDLGIIERNPGMVDALNKGFFSPRFFASRINNIFSPLVYGAEAAVGQGSGRVARLALRDMAGFYSTMASAMAAAKYAGAEVDVDPRSSSFGQIRVGDHTIDLSGGMNRTMGELFQLFVSHGRKAQVTGRNIDYTQPSAIDKNGYEEAMDFLRQKTNVPVSTFINTQLTGNRNVVGEDLGITGNIQMPIGLSNVLDAAYSDLKKHGLADALKAGVATAALEGVGFSSNTYDRGPKPEVTQNPIDRTISNITGIGRPTGKTGRRALEGF